jgi:anthraniloyl-CoA monooxygenase
VKIVSIGGGPSGLYFAILMKKARPDARIVVYERNRSGDTFGFGVVFSDATLDRLKDADGPTYEAITGQFYHWDDIDIHYRGEVVRSTGHGFAGLSRQALLDVLERRALELGVDIRFESEIKRIAEVGEADLVLVADGVNSVIRAELAEDFRPSIDFRPNRFVWLGTTKPFEAFTFYFNESPANRHSSWSAPNRPSSRLDSTRPRRTRQSLTSRRSSRRSWTAIGSSRTARSGALSR